MPETPLHTPKSKPYPHQSAHFPWCLHRIIKSGYVGLLMEQRTGKSWMSINLAVELYHRGLINGHLVIAPTGVHTTWVKDQFPDHLHPDVSPLVLHWRTGHTSTKKFQAQWEALLTHKGLSIFVVNIDAIRTKDLRTTYLPKFLARRTTYTAIDEALDIGDRTSDRGEVALKIGSRSRYRSILEGTPVAAGPLGLYNMTEFLQPGALGFSSFYTFRNHYAVMEKIRVGPDTVRTVVKGYKNLDELQNRLATFCLRITRDQCQAMPAMVFQKEYFELTKEQQRLYSELRDEAITALSTGERVTVSLVLTKYLRLQQITSGFIPPDATASPCLACGGADVDCPECEGCGLVLSKNPPVPIVGGNPRLSAFGRVVGKLDGQGVVWARFTQDVDLLGAWCDEQGIPWVRYDGRVSDAERAEARTKFQTGKARLFIGNSKAGGRGLDLSCANWMIYYSHEWSLRARLQSQDRLINLKKKDPTLYVDILANTTIDEKIVTALRTGKNISDMITGDNPREWL